MIRQRFIEVGARPAQRAPAAQRKIIADVLHQFALQGNPREEHDQLEPEKDLGIVGGAATGGIAIGGEIADE